MGIPCECHPIQEASHHSLALAFVSPGEHQIRSISVVRATDMLLCTRYTPSIREGDLQLKTILTENGEAPTLKERFTRLWQK